MQFLSPILNQISGLEQYLENTDEGEAERSRWKELARRTALSKWLETTLRDEEVLWSHQTRNFPDHLTAGGSVKTFLRRVNSVERERS